MKTVGLLVVLIMALVIGFLMMKRVGTFLESNRNWVDDLSEDEKTAIHALNAGEIENGRDSSKNGTDALGSEQRRI